MPSLEFATPCLLLRRHVVERNCRRMAERMAALDVALRPHMKTAKSAEVALLATEGHSGAITVSTLQEADYFLERGFSDMTYAVGVTPEKLARVSSLQDRGARITLLTDNLEILSALAEETRRLRANFSFLIEIDSGGGRGGLTPSDPRLIELGRAIQQSPGLTLKGVLTHAGQSYACRSVAEVKEVARKECLSVKQAAQNLREHGFPVEVVSAGSTPTATHVEELQGISEMRPGVYVFQDLDQVALGSCGLEDIALCVLAQVIGHNRRSRRLLIDAGALALSKDLSAAHIMENVGYGLLCDEAFRPLAEKLFVAEVHQEHGFVAMAGDEDLPYERFPVGSFVRVLPNHVCMTAAAYGSYRVIGEDGSFQGLWDRVNGW